MKQKRTSRTAKKVTLNLSQKEAGYLIGMLTATANQTRSPDIHMRIFNKTMEAS